MTIKEVIHIFNNSRLLAENFTSEALTKVYVDALAALNKQNAEKPTINGDSYKCPSCGYMELCIVSDLGAVIENFNYCPNCGQRIQWEGQ